MVYIKSVEKRRLLWGRYEYFVCEEDGAKLSISENRLVVSYLDGEVKYFPIETIESISILGAPQLTTQCIQTCLTKGICVSFFSKRGSYYGRLLSTTHINTSLQRKQDRLYESEFELAFAKKILQAKIHNQRVILYRYGKSKAVDVNRNEQSLSNYEKSIGGAVTLQEILGYEGIAARNYFSGLSDCIKEEFRFSGRSRRPPKDPFNAMISLGYSIIMNEIYGIVEQSGLNPYFGLIHRDDENHPTLVSDLLEEWRAVLVDTTALSMINGNEVDMDDFERDSETGGIVIKREAFNKYMRKLNSKLMSENNYMSYVQYKVTFRRALTLQINQLKKAIVGEDISLYEPLRIR